MLIPTLLTAFSLLIVGIFLNSGISKLRPENYAYYKQTIENYNVIPLNLAGLSVRVIGGVEIFIALLTLIPAFQKIGLFMASLLLAVYCYSFIKQLEEGKLGAACGCSGPASDLTISAGLIVRNAVLAILCLLACVTPWTENQISWSIVIPAAIVIGLIYISVEQLLSNNQKIQALRLSKL